MKTKRRHELQTNQLADWLGHKVQAVRPYRQLIIGGALAVVVAVVLIFYMQRASSASKEAAWRSFITMVATKTDPTPKHYEAVQSTGTGDPIPAYWGMLLSADDRLRAASVDLYTDRPTAKEQLLAAKKDYETVIANSAEQPFLRSRAVYGLGQTCECLAALGGDGKTSALDYLKMAKQHYKQLADEASETFLGSSAAHRLKRLENPKVVASYETIASYTPPKIEPVDDTAPPLPDVPDLSFPGDDLPLPERPDLSFPEMALLEDFDDSVPGGGEFQPVETNGEQPAAPDKPVLEAPDPSTDSPDAPTEEAANLHRRPRTRNPTNPRRILS